MLQGILNLLISLAALVAILDWFGIKPNPKSWGAVMPLGKSWKLAIMLGLVAASLALSGYAFYRALRPKVVEKIVEKPVEKLVPQECPKAEDSTSSKRQATMGGGNTKLTPAPVIPTPQSATGNNNTQVGGGITTGPCSNVQVGGSGNEATANCLLIGTSC